MLYNIKAFIRKEGHQYVAECLEVEAFARGGTLDETVENLRFEVGRRIAGADLSEMGFVSDPTLFITLEDVPLMRHRLEC